MGRRKLADGGPFKAAIMEQFGKGLTDAAIGRLVGCSPRTVQYVRQLVGEPSSLTRYEIHGQQLTIQEVRHHYGPSVADKLKRGLTGPALFESPDRIDDNGRALLDRVHQQTGLDYELLRRRYRDGKRGEELAAPRVRRASIEDQVMLQAAHERTGLSMALLQQRYRAGLRGHDLTAPLIPRGKYIRKPKE